MCSVRRPQSRLPGSVRGTKPSICFVALNAYGNLSGREDIAHIGGAEVQQVMIARELVDRGYRVSFVLLDHGQRDAEDLDGITAYKCYRPDAGIRRLRFVHPRLTGLWSAMRCADADIYYQRGAASETGLVAHWCRRNDRSFVYGIANESTCEKLPLILSGLVEQTVYRYGLRRADAIIAQTQTQKELLHAAYGLSASIVRSCYRPSEAVADEPVDDGHILWVGRLSPEKRPEWILDLAGDLPGCQLDVVGSCNTRTPYGDEIVTRIASVPNIKWHAYVPHDRMVSLYKRAQLLLCTSESEGFPNVFLEAWGFGIPVVSAVDPDGIIVRHRIGWVVESYSALRECVAMLVNQPDRCAEYGRSAREYVVANHCVAATVDAFEKILYQTA